MKKSLIILIIMMSVIACAFLLFVFQYEYIKKMDRVNCSAISAGYCLINKRENARIKSISVDRTNEIEGIIQHYTVSFEDNESLNFIIVIDESITDGSYKNITGNNFSSLTSVRIFPSHRAVTKHYIYMENDRYIDIAACLSLYDGYVCSKDEIECYYVNGVDNFCYRSPNFAFFLNAVKRGWSN